jgi:hypothetical protein
MRDFESFNINQKQKKPHLINNILRMSWVIDGILPKTFTGETMYRTDYRIKVLDFMTEDQLIELNCEWLIKIANSKDEDIDKKSCYMHFKKYYNERTDKLSTHIWEVGINSSKR